MGKINTSVQMFYGEVVIKFAFGASCWRVQNICDIVMTVQLIQFHSYSSSIVYRTDLQVPYHHNSNIFLQAV